MPKTNNSNKNIFIDLGAVSTNLKTLKAEIKKRRTELNKAYAALDKENTEIYNLENQVMGLEDILRIGKHLKVAA